MESTELKNIMVEQLSPLDIDIVMEHGGYSLYDRILPEGRQMLANAKNLSSFWPLIFNLCHLERN